MVYGTTDRTIDEAVERVMDNERPDRRDALALLAQPVADAVRAHFGGGTADASLGHLTEAVRIIDEDDVINYNTNIVTSQPIDAVRGIRGHLSTAVLPACECDGDTA